MSERQSSQQMRASLLSRLSLGAHHRHHHVAFIQGNVVIKLERNCREWREERVGGRGRQPGLTHTHTQMRNDKVIARECWALIFFNTIFVDALTFAIMWCELFIVRCTWVMVLCCAEHPLVVDVYDESYHLNPTTTMMMTMASFLLCLTDAEKWKHRNQQERSAFMPSHDVKWCNLRCATPFVMQIVPRHSIHQTGDTREKAHSPFFFSRSVKMWFRISMF